MIADDAAIRRTADGFIEGCGFLGDPRRQFVARAVYEALLAGRPVPVEAIAERVGPEVADGADVAAMLATWPAVFRDPDGAVTGFLGLSIDDAFPHRFEVEGRGVAWTWCTFDPLFVARVLGATALVDTRCPVTGTDIRVVVTPGGVREAVPSTTAMSLLPPDPSDFDHIITTLCHFIWFFATPEAARSWTDEHPGTFVASLDEGHHVARRMTDHVFGAVLGEVPA